MKNLPLLFIAFLLFTANACKKTASCGAHGHDVKGTCACDTSWTGVHCETESACSKTACSIHGHCVSGTCQCDDGWSGSACNQQIIATDAYTGNYHMTGNSQFWRTGDTAYYAPVAVDNTTAISRLDNLNLSVGGHTCTYSAYYSTAYETKFIWYGAGTNQIILTYSRPVGDWVYYYESNSTVTGEGTNTTLQGTKIP